MPVLNWIGKDAVVRHHKDVPFRLLEPVPELSCGGTDAPGNLIVQGDNLHALKALLPRYAGQVKCVYIDPPYNTGNEGWVYNDNVNSPEIRRWLGEVVGREGETLDRHDRWLCMMYPRLVLLKQFLREDGAIFVSIDDNEVANLRLLMDEIFGRNRFVACNVWQKRYSRENRGAIGDVHEYLVVYAMDVDRFQETRNRVPIDEKQAAVYKNPNNDPKGRWRGIPMTAQGYRPNQMYEIETPTGRKLRPPEGRCWSTIESEFLRLKAERRIHFGKNGDSQPSVIRYLSEVEGFVPWTWWPHDEVGHTDESRKEVQAIFGTQTAFDTPKPTRLLQRVIQIATKPGDIILDSFAGSGTTGHAVLKQNAEDGGNRRFILVEMDDAIARNVTAERVRRVAQGYTRGPATLPSPASGRGVGGEGTPDAADAETLSPALSREREREQDQVPDLGEGYTRGQATLPSPAGGRGAGGEGTPGDADEDTRSPAISRLRERGKDRVAGLGGGFQFCRLSPEPLFDADGQVRRDVSFAQLAEFVWFAETGAGFTGTADSPLLGVHEGRAIYLLYNGILKDRSIAGGNVLTGPVYDLLPPFAGPKVIYAAANRMGSRAAREGIVFKQTPYALEV
jgi:DNA modification methylase